MAPFGSDIGSLINLSIAGRSAEWSGEKDVAGAVAAMVCDARVAALHNAGGVDADFILGCTCAWVASELCTTTPDPGRLLSPALDIPKGAAAEALSSRAHAVHADESATLHARSLAGMFLSFLEFDGSMRDAHELVSPFREGLHEHCPDVSLRPLPDHLNGVSAWANRVFHIERGCRRNLLSRALDENVIGSRNGTYDDRFSALASVGWEFGYRDRWSAPDSARAMSAIIERSLFEGGRELHRRIVPQDLDLAWRGLPPRQSNATLRQRAVSVSLGRAGIAKLRLPRLWGEVLAYNNPGILVGLGILLASSMDQDVAVVGNALRKAASGELARRPVFLDRESRSRTRRAAFLRGLWQGVPWLVVLSVALAALVAVGIPGWVAGWANTVATALVVSAARRKAVYQGAVSWPRSVPLAFLLTLIGAAPPLGAAFVSRAVWSSGSMVLYAAGVAFSAVVATFVVASPYVAFKLGPGEWVLQEAGVPNDLADAFDDALSTQLLRRRR